MKKLFLIFLFLGGMSVYAQDSLFHYIEIALHNNPLVLQKFAEYQSALQKVPQAGSLPDPELSAGIFLSPMEQISGNQVADIRLMQMFPWFGVLRNAKDEMSLMAKARYESFRDVKLQVSFDVQQTWYELCKNQEIIALTQHNLELLQSIERLQIIKFQAPQGKSVSTQANMPSPVATGSSGAMQGMGSSKTSVTATPLNSNSGSMNNTMGNAGTGSGLTDVYKIQIEKAELDNTIQSLLFQKRELLVVFNTLLNRPDSASVVLLDTLAIFQNELEHIQFSDSSLHENPMATMLNFEKQSLNSRYNMVKRMSYPMVGLGVNYSVFSKSEMSTSPMNGRDMIMPMVTVTLPIYRGKYRAQKSEIEYSKQAVEANYQNTMNELRKGYTGALRQFDDARRRVSLYQTETVLIAKTLAIQTHNLATSETSLSEYIRTLQQKLQIEIQYATAVSDFLVSKALVNRFVNTNI